MKVYFTYTSFSQIKLKTFPHIVIAFGENILYLTTVYILDSFFKKLLLDSAN